MTILEKIVSLFKQERKPLTLKEISNMYPEKPETTLRARIYENKDKFERIARGVYVLKEQNEKEEMNVALIQGNGRDLSKIEDNSIDAIITDHPWSDPKSNKGGTRNFDNTYNTFRYTIEDMKEQARVLKDGGFMVQILPSENENNWKYLYEIKSMLEEVGVKYYSKVPWKKGNFVSNTGRKSKNTEDVLIFTKGKPRNLRLDKKKMKAEGGMHYMSGTTKMLPTEFDVQPKHIKKRIHQAEKPVQLYKEILEYITLPNETVLDMFAGSGNLGIAALEVSRKAILIEILEENIEKIKTNIESYLSDKKEKIKEKVEKVIPKISNKEEESQLTLF